MCVGMAGVLDSSRMKYFLSRELDVSIKNIETFVLGGHGDTMVPLLRYTTVSGVPIQELVKKRIISQKKLDLIVKRTKDGGGEINKLLKKGSVGFAESYMEKDFTSDNLSNLLLFAYENQSFFLKKGLISEVLNKYRRIKHSLT